MITNLDNLVDGFGEQFKFLIFCVLYSEFLGKDFYYTPFKTMEHNYDNDKDFLKKKEDMINFKNNFSLVTKDTDFEVPCKFKLISFIEKNIKFCETSKSLQKIKDIFRIANKDTYDKNFINIAIHIRRMNKHDKENIKHYIQHPGTDVPNELYQLLIKQLKNIYKNSKIHIYSQGEETDFPFDDVIFHLNESIESTFINMVYADVLLIAPSSLSYTAGLLSNGIIYYIKHYHTPLSHWNKVTGYISSRDKYKFFMSIDDGKVYIPIQYNIFDEKFYIE